MARFSEKFKGRAVARLLPPESAAVDVVAREVGIGSGTLERWRDKVLSMPARGRAWTAAARLEAVIVTAALDETGKNAWCREHGVYPGELLKWRSSATTALAEPEEVRASPQATRQDKKRIKELERELLRKDRALAETAALLVLSKKSRRSSTRERTNDRPRRSPGSGPRHPHCPCCRPARVKVVVASVMQPTAGYRCSSNAP